MASTKSKSQHGAFLIGVLVFVVLLSIILLAVTTLVTNQSSYNSLYLEERKAFYAAESGLELAIADINSGGDGILDNVSIGEAVINTTFEGDTLITSTATTSRGYSQLQIKVRIPVLPDAFRFAICTFNPAYKLQLKGPHYKYLQGDIFTYSQQGVAFQSDVVLDTVTVNVEEGIPVDNQTPFPIKVKEFPAGTEPVKRKILYTEYYDDYINNVGGYPSYPSSTISSDLDLSTLTDSVLYYNGDLQIKSGCTITGPGVIVSTGKLVVKDAATIGDNVQLISDDVLQFTKGSILTGMRSVLYSSTRVEIKDSYTSVSGSVMSPTEVKIDCASDFDERGIMTGIFFSVGVLTIKHTHLRGSVVGDYIANEDFHCVYAVWDKSYLPPVSPPGLSTSSSGLDTALVVDDSWRIVR